MKINQVEELVEITKKNIRFYEDQGLLCPDRNPENGYRDYNLKDVDTLMKIKLLRKLSVPIEEIRSLQDGSLSFDTCMERQMSRFQTEQHNLKLATQLCERLSDEVTDLSMLKASEYLSQMKQMEEGGTKFMDIEKHDIKQKKYGSFFAAFVMILLMIVLIGFILWANSIDSMPIGILILTILPFVVIIIGALVALKLRINEINGGEEDEASKY